MIGMSQGVKEVKLEKVAIEKQEGNVVEEREEQLTEHQLEGRQEGNTKRLKTVSEECQESRQDPGSQVGTAASAPNNLVLALLHILHSTS